MFPVWRREYLSMIFVPDPESQMMWAWLLVDRSGKTIMNTLKADTAI